MKESLIATVVWGTVIIHCTHHRCRKEALSHLLLSSAALTKTMIAGVDRLAGDTTPQAPISLEFVCMNTIAFVTKDGAKIELLRPQVGLALLPQRTLYV